MKSAILVIIVTVCFVPSVMSLDCYKCSSVTSWDDCKKEKVTCPAGSDTCVEVSVQYDNKKKFEMYCGKQEQCNTQNNPTCNLGKDAGFNACNLNCNEGVNAGSTAGVSGIVMMACAMVVLFLKA